jgi:membrane-bound ClpP family serine protease
MHAWLAFLGGVCAVVGALLLSAAFSGVSYYGIDAQMEIALAIIVIVIAILAAWILYKGVTANLATVKTGKEALIGSKGVAVTDLKPKGEIRVMGEFWQATVKEEQIANGEMVEVIGMEGMFLVVKRSEEKPKSPTLTNI